jgi:hypothetical protein
LFALFGPATCKSKSSESNLLKKSALMRMAIGSPAPLRDGIRTQNLGRGKRFGGPPAVADALRIAECRASGASWRSIDRQLALHGETVKKIARCSEKKVAYRQRLNRNRKTP